MKTPKPLIGAYRPKDFDKLATFYVERCRESGRKMTPEEIAAILERPGFTAEKDIFLAMAGESIIGYAWITPERGVDRVILGGWVDPTFRRKGLASNMLDRVLARVRELGIGTISAEVSQENRSARAILPKLGFTYVRRYLDLGLDTVALPHGDVCRECRRLDTGEEIRVMELQNRVFRDHWRYNYYDLETFVYDTNLNNRSSGDIIVYCTGDAVIGYCWTEIYEFSGISGTEKRAIINMLGVEEEYRRKGIGRQTLLAGLSHLRDSGVRSVSLQVDSENKVARELYHSVGFREYGSSLWYERGTR